MRTGPRLTGATTAGAPEATTTGLRTIGERTPGATTFGPGAIGLLTQAWAIAEFMMDAKTMKENNLRFIWSP